jgi:hypothetical protein
MMGETLPQEPQNGECPQLRLYTEHDAGSPGDHHGAAGNHGGFRGRYILGSRVLRHLLAMYEMVNSVVNKKPAEDHSADQEGYLHGILRQNTQLDSSCE